MLRLIKESCLKKVDLHFFAYSLKKIIFIHANRNGDHLSCYYGLSVIMIVWKCCFHECEYS